jgi:flagellar basal-body rod protein FlgB
MRGGVPTVRILQNLFGPQSENYDRSLSRLSLRQSVLTGNLANINTPGYKRREVDFAIELAQAEQPFPSLDGAAIKTEAGSVRIDENSVDLEREVYELGENEIRFQTTTHMAKSYFRGLKNVIREGR